MDGRLISLGDPGAVGREPHPFSRRDIRENVNVAVMQEQATELHGGSLASPQISLSLVPGLFDSPTGNRVT